MPTTKKVRRAVNGLLLLDKPIGISSNAALQKVRFLLNAAKAGHTGSLDPLATGVLPLCFGEATKFSQHLLEADKGYIVRLQLGVTTTTDDAEGTVLEKRPVTVSLAALEAVLPRFLGTIEQIPPMYSALKHQGRPLYQLARAGEVVERSARSVTIHHLHLLDWATNQATLEVSCTKGTYIRTLVADIGALLGCGAHVVALRRIQAGAFSIQQSITLPDLEKVYALEGSAGLDQFLLPVDSCLAHWPSIQLSEKSAYYWLQGQAVRISHPNFGWVRVLNQENCFIGIGEVCADGYVAPRRLIRCA